MLNTHKLGQIPGLKEPGTCVSVRPLGDPCAQEGRPEGRCSETLSTYVQEAKPAEKNQPDCISFPRAAEQW